MCCNFDNVWRIFDLSKYVTEILTSRIFFNDNILNTDLKKKLWQNLFHFDAINNQIFIYCAVFYCIRQKIISFWLCWPMKKMQVQRLMLVDMRMIRWICGYIKMDRIRNEVIRHLVKVTLVEDKMREIKLIWFDHVKRSSIYALVKRCERINIPEGKRGRGRPKKSLDEVIRDDLKVVGLMEDMTRDMRFMSGWD